MNRSDLQSFLANVMFHCSEGPVAWTVEDAQYNLDCWKGDGIEDLPDDITAEDVAAIWNHLMEVRK